MSAFARRFSISGRAVGGEAPCYVIAEAGVAHFGNVDKAFALVDLAVDAKADAVKFQHFRSDRLVGPSSPEWRDRLRSRELSDGDMQRVADHARKRGITFLCTAHDEHALDFLDRTVGVPAFKIGSGEVENWPYIGEIARRGKPIIISTGMYTSELIRKALDVLSENGCNEVAVLHCVTSYPADPATINLDAMRQIGEFFEGPVGYSDHTHAAPRLRSLPWRLAPRSWRSTSRWISTSRMPRTGRCRAAPTIWPSSSQMSVPSPKRSAANSAAFRRMKKSLCCGRARA